MSRLHYNLTAWPCFIAGVLFITLGNGDYLLDANMNLLLNVIGLAFYIFATVLLVLRLRSSAVNAWFALLVIVPLGQLILMTLASFLPVKEINTNE